MTHLALDDLVTSLDAAEIPPCGVSSDIVERFIAATLP